MIFFTTFKKQIAKTLLVATLSLFVLVPLLSPISEVYAYDEGTGSAQIANGATSLAPDSTDFGCLSSGGDTSSKIAGCIAALTYNILMKGTFQIAAWIGLFFNYVLFQLVVGMGSLVNGLPGIMYAWQALRDMANLFLVFLLIYVGIATILGISGWGYKQLLWRVILAALLVNFSVTFTKFVIDVSNIFAIETFASFITTSTKASIVGATPAQINAALGKCFSSTSGSFGNEAVNGNGGNPCVEDGIAGAFWTALKVTSLFDIKPLLDGASATTGDVSDAQWKMALTAFMASGMFLVLAFVFGAAALLLVSRFVILIFLIIVSPVALVAWITKASSLGSKWWKTLIDQSLFAPLILLMWWIAYLIVSSSASLQSAGSLGGGITNMSSLAVVVQFVIICGFLIASLVIAKSMGAHGAGAIMNVGSRWGKALTVGAVGAGVGLTAGFTSRKLLEKYNRNEARLHEKTTNADGKEVYVRDGKLSRMARSGLGQKLERGFKNTLEAPQHAKLIGGKSYKERKDGVEKAQKERQAEFTKINRGNELRSAVGVTEYSGNVAYDENRASEVLGKMSDAEMHDNIAQFEKRPESFGHFKQAQFDRLIENKDNKYTPEQITKFKKGRADYFKALDDSTPEKKTALETKIKGMGSKEQAELLKHRPELASAVSHDAFAKLMQNTDGKYTEAEINDLKSKRNAYFNSLTGTALTEHINKANPKELASLEKAFFENDEVINNLDLHTLNAMTKQGLSKEKRDAIKAKIKTKYGPIETKLPIFGPNGQQANSPVTLTDDEKKVKAMYDFLHSDVAV